MAVTSMDHLLVLADDIEATRDFYCHVVGLRVGERPELEFPGYWLYAGATACLHIAERRPYRDHAASIGLGVDGEGTGTGSVDHIAFTATEIDELLARLDRAGVSAVHNQVSGGGPFQVFIEDPNGIRVEINSARS